MSTSSRLIRPDFTVVEMIRRRGHSHSVTLCRSLWHRHGQCETVMGAVHEFDIIRVTARSKAFNICKYELDVLRTAVI